MYVIQDGEVEVVRTHNGSTVRLAVLGPGEFFGEMGFLTGEKRSASISATRYTTLIKIGKEEFSAILDANPLISDQIGHIMANRLADNAAHVDHASAAVPSSLTLIRKIKIYFGI